MASMVTPEMANLTLSSSGLIPSDEYLVSIRDINYDRYIGKDAKSIKPFIFTIDEKTYVFVGWDCNETLKKIKPLVYKEWKCIECKTRSDPLSRIISNDGSKHFLKTKTMTNDEQCIAASFSKKSVITNWTIKLIPHITHEIDIVGYDLRKLFQRSTTAGAKQGFKQFNHYYLDCPRSSENITNPTLIQKALSKYTLLIINLFDNHFSRGGYDAVCGSIDIFKECLDEAPYAKTFLNGVGFIERLINFVKLTGKKDTAHLATHELIDVIGKTILSSKIESGENGDALITGYHQFTTNILDMFKSARSKEAMIKILTERCAPENYQRRTAAPTVNQIKKSMELFGDFDVSICTTKQLMKHIPTTVKLDGPPSTIEVNGSGAMAAMQSMIDSQKHKNKYAFGSRVSISKPTNIKQLFEQIRSGKIHTVHVQCPDYSYSQSSISDPHYVENTYIGQFNNLNKDYLITDGWGWIFLNKQTPRFIGKQKVSHIAPINVAGHKNYHFIFEQCCSINPKKKITSTISFPEILSNTIRRSHGATFEEIGRKMNVKYPPPIHALTEESLAIGVGVCESNRYGSLTRSITIYINDDLKTPIQISHGGLFN
tara:strand:+ start:24618 stop:26417 length:1800 start_codon:yes stop_codon:yes gene_type:complete